MYNDKLQIKGLALILNGVEVPATVDAMDLVIVPRDGVVYLELDIACPLSEQIETFLKNRKALELGLVAENDRPE